MDIKGYFERKLDDIIEELDGLCRIPSVSATFTSIKEATEAVEELLLSIGAKTRVFTAPNEYPVVFGEIQGTKKESILFYNHYDVMPVEPGEDWKTEPFAATKIGHEIIGRGVSDNKGDFIARLNAVRAAKELGLEIPTVKFFVEGGEEMGSPKMEELVKEEASLFKSHGCVFEGSAMTVEERPKLIYGRKGYVFLELEAIFQQPHNLHSSFSGVVNNPIHYLSSAIATLITKEGRVMIPHFYDDAYSLNDEEKECLKEYNTSPSLFQKMYEIEELIVEEKDFSYDDCIAPSLTICGFTGGYAGPGAKTVIPNHARASLDVRLSPGQLPEEMERRIRDHLDKNGFSDLRITNIMAEPGLIPPLDSAIARSALEAMERVYEKKPQRILCHRGGSPLYRLCGTLDMPLIDAGISYYGSNIHGANENIRVNDLLQGLCFLVELLRIFSIEDSGK